jgi:hypothetical protein
MTLRLRTDGSASAELPLQLIITLLVLSIAMGIVYEGMDTYRRAQADTLASSLARSIDTTANQVVKGGNMTTLMVKVSYDDSSAEKIDWFRIGEGPKHDGIYYKVAGGPVQQRFVGRPLLKYEDGVYEQIPLELGKGSFLINLRHVQDTTMDPQDFVAVWVSWTG